jgi:ferredoxin/flavodoxin
MKGLLCYYSGSGNTRLACQYILQNLSGIEFTLFDIVKEKNPDFKSFDIIGFAAFADFLGPSQCFVDFIKQIPKQSQKPAFVFNTYGNFNAGTLNEIRKLVTRRGFKVIAGHALHMPENIPTMIVIGLANVQAPNSTQLIGFKNFINQLNTLCADLSSDTVRKIKFKLPLFDRLLPPMPRFVGKMVMGKKYVDKELCSKCSACVNTCPYGAIEIKEYPEFNQKKCFACWACYNHCPVKAIYTKKYRGVAQYPGPIPVLREKLPLEK